jgi:glyoxylase-like metal-dependent hydrolase (beta-lactamase superfamily II)
MSSEPNIHTFHEPVTGTWQYIVADPDSKDAVIIDSVLNFDAAASKISTESADYLLAQVDKLKYKIVRLLETHVHADHLTGSGYLQKRLLSTQGTSPSICIGKRIGEVQSRFGGVYGIAPAELNGAFDQTFDDHEKFSIGHLEAKVLHLPGHTPDHIGYLIGRNVFTGDSIFNPDVGSARCDFPGGSATELHASMSILLALPPDYRLYTGHDYPPETREAGEDGSKAIPFTTVERQRNENKHVKVGTKKEEFIQWRSDRDSGLAEPKLIHQALQFNIRAGHLPAPESGGYVFFKVPVKNAQVLL